MTRSLYRVLSLLVLVALSAACATSTPSPAPAPTPQPEAETPTEPAPERAEPVEPEVAEPVEPEAVEPGSPAEREPTPVPRVAPDRWWHLGSLDGDVPSANLDRAHALLAAHHRPYADRRDRLDEARGRIAEEVLDPLSLQHLGDDVEHLHPATPAVGPSRRASGAGNARARRRPQGS